MKTIQMTIDERLLKSVDRLCRTRKLSRSALIRTALEAELARERIHEAERLHVEGYRARPVVSGEFDAWVAEQDWGPA